MEAARSRYSREILILNAQFLSRAGFVIAEIHEVKYDAYEAIEQRHELIGTNNATCLLAAVEGIDYAIGKIDYSIKEILGEMNFAANESFVSIFEPLIESLQRESTTIQLKIMRSLDFAHLILEQNELIQYLEGILEEFEIIDKLTNEEIDKAFAGMRSLWNEWRAATLGELENYFSNFNFQTTIIVELLEDCYPDAE